MTSVPARSDFERIDWAEPLDGEASIARVPDDAQVRGMFINAVLKLVIDAGHTPAKSRYTPFKLFPLAEMMRVQLDASATLWPKTPVREGLRRLGCTSYPALRESMVGRVMFGAFGDDLQRIFAATAKAYGVSLTRGRATVLETSPNHAVVHMQDMHNFHDSYHAGVLEGGFERHGARGEIKKVTVSETEVFLLAQWSKR